MHVPVLSEERFFPPSSGCLRHADSPSLGVCYVSYHLYSDIMQTVLCVCVRVCVCVCVCTSVSVCIYECVSTQCIYIHLCVYKFVCVCV